MREPIIDAWIQHPSGRFIGHDMFASLRRWMKLEVIPEEIPIELTLAALDAAGVGSVNLHRPMDAVRELRRCVNELGFVGVRQLPHDPTCKVNGPAQRAQPVAGRAKALPLRKRQEGLSPRELMENGRARGLAAGFAVS